MNSSPRRNLDAALRYAGVGWPVFPVVAGGKEPATRNGFLDATTDHALIERWWSRHPEFNIGIATGAPGPDVLDVDNHGEQGNGFASFNRLKRAGQVDGYGAIVRTPSTGFHLYFAGTGQRSGKLPAQHIDFRSQGGYVVAPPSGHSGADYVVVKHQPVSRTVDWDAIRKHLEPQREERQPERDRSRDSGDVDRLVNWVSRQEHGNRNDGLFYAVNRVLDYGLLTSEAEERLISASVAGGLRGGEREARRTIESAKKGRWYPKSREEEREVAS